MHRANHTQIISVPTEARVNAADRQAALAVVSEFKRCLCKMPDGSTIGAYCVFAVILFAVPLGKCRFGIESVNMTRSAIQEQKNYVLGLGGKVPWLGGELATERLVAAEQIDQAQARKASARLPQKLTACLPAGRFIWNESGAGVHIFGINILGGGMG
jgi:hypothetical protein